MRIPQGLRQIALLHIVVRVIVGVLIGGGFVRAGTVSVDVFQVPGDVTHRAALNILHSGDDSVVGAVGFGRGGQQHRRLGQGQPRLRQAQL